MALLNTNNPPTATNTATDKDTDTDADNSSFDEPISLVIEHFRPKPIFTINKRVELESSVYQYRHNNAAPITKRKRNRKGRQQTGGFSCVMFHQRDMEEERYSYLRFSYLVDVFVVVLNVMTDPPFTVSLVTSIPDANINNIQNQCCQHMAAIQNRVTELCQSLNQHSQQNTNSLSLFAVVSKLLKALNDDTIMSNDVLLFQQQPASIRQHFGALYNHLVLQNKKQQRQVVALAILLLRCAVVCPKRDTLCCPVPTFSHHDHHHHNNDPMTVMAKRILSLPDLSTLSTTAAAAAKLVDDHQASNLSPWLALFYSLSWITHGHLRNTNTNTNNNNNIRTTTGRKRRRRRRTYTVTLDLGHNVFGHDTPRFARLAKRQGLLQQQRACYYHGTQVQHVWSILHHGLQPVRAENSNTLTQSNGAAYGEGVYVTPSWKVAAGYAERTPSDYYVYANALQLALHHPALLSVLGINNTNNSSTTNTNTNTNTNIRLEDYRIKCFPVFEATVILPSPPSSATATTTTTTSDGVAHQSTAKDNITTTTSATATRGNNKNQQEDDQLYVVIPNPHDIRLDKLHLTFELEPVPKIMATSTGSASFWWKLLTALVLVMAYSFASSRSSSGR